MKKITTILLLAISITMNAQYHQVAWTITGENPRLLNNDPEQPESYLSQNGFNWSAVLAPGATAWSSTQTIPFPFKFNGVMESSYTVHPAGLVTFSANPAAPPAQPTIIPSASLPDKTAVLWGMNLSGTNDGVVSKTFGTYPYRQHWIMWASASYTTGTNWAYWAVVFEESTNNIYIVDQRTYAANNANVSLVVGIQVNGSTAVNAPGSPNVQSVTTSTAGNGSDMTDNKVYSFLPQAAQADWDVAGQSINLPQYLQINTNANIVGSFVNNGYNTVSSVGIAYKIDGGATQTATASGLSAAPGAIASFTLSNALNFTTQGQKNIKLWFTTANGNGDANHLNDTVYGSVNVVSALTQRIPLMETFTSSTCPPCVPANTNMEQIFAANPGEYVSVKYQMSWPGTGDPYYTLEGLTRRQLYGITAVPWMLIDGGWNENGNSLTQGIFDQYQQVPAFVNLGATYTVNGNTKTVSGTVTINPLANVSGNLNLFIAIKENRTTQNIKSNGETEFFQVMKKMVPDGNGEVITGGLTAGTPITKPFSYTFNGNYTLPPNATAPLDPAVGHSVEEFYDLSVAVWVQDMTTKEVLQAANGVQTQYIGLEEAGVLGSLNVYPNPAADVAFVSINMENNADATITMVNTLGQVVLNKETSLETGSNKIELNTSSLTAGVYFVQVEINGEVQTVKISVQ